MHGIVWVPAWDLLIGGNSGWSHGKEWQSGWASGPLNSWPVVWFGGCFPDGDTHYISAGVRVCCPLQVAVDSQKFTDPHVKANALLQAHFSRTQVGVGVWVGLWRGPGGVCIVSVCCALRACGKRLNCGVVWCGVPGAARAHAAPSTFTCKPCAPADVPVLFLTPPPTTTTHPVSRSHVWPRLTCW